MNCLSRHLLKQFKHAPRSYVFSVQGTRGRKYSKNISTSYANAKGLSYINVPGTKPLWCCTLGDLVNSAPDRFGDRLAIVDRHQNVRLTFVQYKNEIDRLATGLLAIGLKRGDRVAVWSPNRYEWALTQFATAKIGVILTTINPSYQAPEAEYCINKLKIRAVVAPETFKSQDYYKILTSFVPEIAESKSNRFKSKKYPFFDTLVLMSDTPKPGAINFRDVMQGGGSEQRIEMEKIEGDNSFDDAINIQFTSGTTGKPKAVTLTHHNIINNVLGIGERIGYDPARSDQRICGQVPLFHCFGCVLLSSIGLVFGVANVYPSQGFDPEASLKTIEEERCTAIYGTPTMFVDLLNHPNFKKTDFSSLENGVIAGAPCPPELMKRVVENMNCKGLVNAYGCTEISPIICTSLSDDSVEMKSASVGKVMPHTEAKVVDEKGRLVPFGAEGEVCARGYLVMKGYWEDEEKTKEVVIDRWYHTGDVGTLTEDGTIRIIGRIKDMIIRGGENIYPTEIEDLLTKHPNIVDAHVFGVPDDRLGESVAVWVKIKTNQTMDEKELQEFCKGKISSFKIPRHIKFVDDFPKTVSGKVQKFVMRDQMAAILAKSKSKS